MSQSAITQGIHHLGLTVPDIRHTADFFIEQLHFAQVGEKPEYPAIFVSDGTVMLTLWQVQADDFNAFNRHSNIGLHHVALQVKNLESLHQLSQKFSQLDSVDIEFLPEQIGQSNNYHLMCLIPGGVRVEFFAAG
ncbi:VOC family protein [Echinimonas agarilytica]|uniref:VOC family protein n=1 Tax=Echinimonas agarilytica TaxID=1215918 RepID=A0AA42B782_9GAMM|nr:VOC family protein [Echinimonas agarilytica]MCM2679585.1 VOC family protein [Echinimonas agarilytica]